MTIRGRHDPVQRATRAHADAWRDRTRPLAIAVPMDRHDAADDARARRAAWQMAALGAALLGFVFGSTRAGAQEAGGSDPRWRPFLGCWMPAEASNTARPDAAPLTCIVPDGRDAVRMLPLVEGRVVDGDRIVASGARTPVREDGCDGWESATWSSDGRRLHLNGEVACDGTTRRASGMLAMVGDGVLADVRVVRAGSGGGVRVLRLVPSATDVTLPDGRVVPGRFSRAIGDARLAAAGEITVREVIEASRAVDERVVEAWLLERREGVPLDARALVALDEGKVPARTVDLLVAFANPTRFTVSVARPGRADVAAVPRAAATPADRPRSLFPGWGVYDPAFWNPAWGWSDWGLMNPIAAPWYGYNSLYGNAFFGGPWGGWVGPLGPIVIAPVPPSTGGIPGQPGSGSPGRRPTVVNGEGYTRTPPAERPTMTPRGVRGDGGSGSAGGGGSSGGASSTGGGGRTAKPRSP